MGVRILRASQRLPAEHLRFAYVIAALCVGILVGAPGWFAGVTLGPRLLLFLFLPAILFDAAFKLDTQGLRPVLRRAGVLGIPGALLAAALLAGALLALHFPQPIALVLAAVIAATDPVSVFALLRGLPIPPGLRGLLEGESLINDGTAVVLFALAVEAVDLGSFGWQQAAVRFVLLYGGGLLLGLLWGMLFVWFFQRLEDGLVAVLVSVVVAYGGYLLAEWMQASGVVLVVVAGMLVGATRRVKPRPREVIHRTWDYLAFAASTVIFLLVGLEFRLGALPSEAVGVALVVVAALAARTVAVLLTCTPLGQRSRVRRNWQPVLIWGGVRGALTLALVLSLPAGFPERARILTLTVGFVLVSMIVQGLTLRGLIRRLPAGADE
jgi:CPA1 family monovalent cation:H+ antiporter